MNVRDFAASFDLVVEGDPDTSEHAETLVVVSVPGIGPCKVTGIHLEQHSDSFAGAETLWIRAEEM